MKKLKFKKLLTSIVTCLLFFAAGILNVNAQDGNKSFSKSSQKKALSGGDEIINGQGEVLKVVKPTISNLTLDSPIILEFNTPPNNSSNENLREKNVQNNDLNQFIVAPQNSNINLNSADDTPSENLREKNVQNNNLNQISVEPQNPNVLENGSQMTILKERTKTITNQINDLIVIPNNNNLNPNN